MTVGNPALNLPGQCPDPQTLSKLSSGRLSLDELDCIAGHVAGCQQCAQTLSTLDNAGDDLMVMLREPVEADELSQADSRALIARVQAIRSARAAVLEIIPRTLGRYQLLTKLGEGGMGVVYQAKNINLGKVVALKMLGSGRITDAAAIDRLRREMKSVGALHHANIVGALDADEIDGVPFLVMEYVEGIDLAELTRRVGRLDVADACELIRQAAVGLDYAHHHGLVHRDIKPSNLMLDAHAQLKVLDLGLALLAEDGADELTSAGSIMGTADYMAPEQADDSHHVDARADVYSLGCTLFKLLCGRPPFAGPGYNTSIKKALAHASQPPPALHDVRAELPAGLSEIVARSLAKQPPDRFGSAGELASALAPFCGGSRLVELFQRAGRQESSRSDVVILPAAATGEPRAPVGEPGASATGGSLAAIPPRRPPRGALLGAAGAGALALLLGVILVIRDRHGQELQRFELPDGASISIEQSPTAASAAPKAPTPAIAPFDAKQARASQQAWADYLGTPLERKNSIGMWLVLIPPGEFQMGSTPEEMAVGRKMAEADSPDNQALEKYLVRIKAEAPPHRVRLTRPYRLGNTEVTVGQFKKFFAATQYVTEAEQFGFGDSPKAKADDQVKARYHGLTWRSPSYPVTDDSPVTQVTWNDAVHFCNWLSDQEGLKRCYRQDAVSGWVPITSGTGYRLPTEAEWEYACRAGTTTQFSFGDDSASLDRYAWTLDNAHGAPRAVGLKPANPFGLFDMHGNVTEWCQDFYAPSYDPKSSPNDPIGPARSASHVVRGGSADGHAVDCRAANRAAGVPISRDKAKGFRIAVSQPAEGGPLRGSAGIRAADRPHPAAEPPSPRPAEAAKAPTPAIAPFDAKQARASQQAWADYLGTPLERANSLGMWLVLIPPGEFLMGSTPEEIAVGRKIAEADSPPNHDLEKSLVYVKAEAPQHRVRLTRPCRLGNTEVTVGQFKKFVAAAQYVTEAEQFGFGNSAAAKANAQAKAQDHGLTWRSPGYPVTDDSPVTQVTWNDAVHFCNWLSNEEGLKRCYRQDAVSGWVPITSGTGYRLPTEAEWEFACRAGTTTQFSFGDDSASLGRCAWTGDNAHGTPRAVGLKLPNPFGLFDMHGNVNEWCQDFYVSSYDPKSSPDDPIGPERSASHVLRGGSAVGHAVSCRAANRLGSTPMSRHKSVGFRIAVSQPTEGDPLPGSAGMRAADRPHPAAAPSSPRPAEAAKAPAPAIAPFDAKQARAYQAAWARHLGTPVERANSIGMKLMLIPPGEFTMGAGEAEVAAELKGKDPEKDRDYISEVKSAAPRHTVNISQPFWLATTEVTVGQFRKFAAATKYQTDAERDGKGGIYYPQGASVQSPEITWSNPGHEQTEECPVVQISWNDAAEFCNWLSRQEGLPPAYADDGSRKWRVSRGPGYRLPTEAQWEYACRAGTTTVYFWGDDVKEIGYYCWYGSNSGGKAQPVGAKLPNAFGLLDIQGNAREWVQDFNDDGYFANSPAVDPTGPIAGSSRVIRGCSWYATGSYCRSASRHRSNPSDQHAVSGFRLARAP